MGAGNGRYENVTQGVRITVAPHYREEHSKPEADHWVWAYEIEISNESDMTVQLRSRHWEITDARGKIEQVDGPGVIGEQPILNPGDQFQYSSGCPLSTPSGFMVGHYNMQREDGSTFQANIPAFALDLPDARPSLN